MHLISGVVTGQFYDENGQPTQALLQVKALLAEGQQIKAQSDAKKTQFPGCNSEWITGRGGRVWCSTKRYEDSFGLSAGKNSVGLCDVFISILRNSSGFTGLCFLQRWSDARLDRRPTKTLLSTFQ